jgi:hypothetical protein
MAEVENDRILKEMQPTAVYRCREATIHYRIVSKDTELSGEERGFLSASIDRGPNTLASGNLLGKTSGVSACAFQRY